MHVDIDVMNNTFYIEAQEPNKAIFEIASSNNSDMNIDIGPEENHVNIDVNSNDNDVNVDIIDKDIVISFGGISSEFNDLSSAVTWVNVPDANITESSVTQHQSALTITESQISDLGSYSTTDTQLTEEQVEDFVGGMLTGNTETGITVTYQNDDGTIDFVVASQTDENFTTADHSKLDGIEAGATANDTDTNLKNRSNHTGTQVASTISDFDTAVTDNAAVVANTAKISNATHTGDVTGSDTLAIANNAITPDKIGVGTFVFNEAGANYDFRVEGDTDTNLLFLDASKDSVLIGNSSDGSVGSKLHIYEANKTNSTYSRTINSLGRAYSTTDGTYYHTGLNSRAEKYLSASTTDGGYCIGVNAVPVIYSPDGTNTLHEVAAFRCNPSINSAASNVTITNAYDIKTVPYFQGTNNTITNHYGLYLGNAGLGGTTPTNEYGVYQDNTAATNYFGGNIGIGTDNPSGKLHIQDGTLHILSDGSIPHFELVDTDTDNTLRLNATNSVFAFNLDPDENITGSELRFNVDNSDKFILKSSINELKQTTQIEANNNLVQFGNSSTVINGNEENIDLQVKGDSDANLFYVDASTDRIGLGTDTPLTKLHIHATDSEGTILSQTDLDTSFAGFLVRNQDNVNVFSAQYCNSAVAQTTLRNTILIGSRESDVAVKFYQGKESTNLIGAGGAFETNNERIIFDVDGNTILTAASGQNVQVSGVELDVDGDVKGVSFIKDGGSSNEFLKADGSIDTNIYLTASNSIDSLSDVALNTPINNNQVLSYSGGSFTNTDLALSLMKRGSIPFGGYSSDQMGHYFFFDGSSEAVINTDGDNIDFRVEGDGDQNLLFCDASVDKVGIGTTDPTQKLDIDSDGIRIRDDKTPASASATGDKGDIAWDSDYIYVCVATDTWKRSALSTW